MANSQVEATLKDVETRLRGAVAQLRLRAAPAQKAIRVQALRARRELERGRKELAKNAKKARAGVLDALGVASKTDLARLNKKIIELAKKVSAA